MHQKNKEKITVIVGNQEISFETGQVARQAGGAVIAKAGETVVFATACATKDPLENTDFLPLRIDYQEKFSSAGKTVGGFFKREGRPTERETLVSRLIDRPIRPMIEEGYFHDIQILTYVWSYDGVHGPEPLAICAASAALVISDIPLIKPIAAVRVGLVNGSLVINPSHEAMETSKLDLMIAGTEDAVLMIEGYGDFLSDDEMLAAVAAGHEAIAKICHALSNWQKKVGKQKNRSTLKPIPKDVLQAVSQKAVPLLRSALAITDKQQREKAQATAHEQILAMFIPENAAEAKFSPTDIKNALKEISSDVMRAMVLEKNIRCDGRKTDEIRNITIEQSFLPRTHGSSLFTRGETQTLAVCTLGGQTMAQRYEDLHGEGTQRFYLQYFFPPFSVGEVGRVGAPGRREVGHGKLAERALQAALPSPEEFPYTIRVESNITESNGSSSMASVCGGCLAMMDAGVPIKRPVAGIAMGLILEGENSVILSDILGVEDALGDMDFKVTGDKNGITAFQMDIKVEGITIEIMKKAIAQAKRGIAHILDIMVGICPESRKEMSTYAPRIEVIRVKPSKIGTIIGPGGKQIRQIIEETGVEIDINDDGIVSLSSPNLESIEQAKAIISGLIAEIEIGSTYKGKVVSIVAFGAFIEILPGKEGLCHISEFAYERIENLNEFTKVGDVISVKVLDINERGQIKLSRKALLSKPEPTHKQ